MSDVNVDNIMQNTRKHFLRSHARNMAAEAAKRTKLSDDTDSSIASTSGKNNCAKQLEVSNSKPGCSRNSVQSCTMRTQNKGKSTKSKNVAKRTPPVKREQNVSTRKASGHRQSTLSFLNSMSEQNVSTRKASGHRQSTLSFLNSMSEQNVSTRKASGHGQSKLSFLSSLSDPIPHDKCDSEAEYYKKNFKKVKDSLGKKLYQLYNEKVFDNKLPHDMILKWSTRMKKSAGYCYSRRSVATGQPVRSSYIVLSNEVVVSPDRMRDILIHEMCHAASWLLDLRKDGHGPCWKAWAKKAMTIFPELPPLSRTHKYDIPRKFKYECVGCAYSVETNSKSFNLTGRRCGFCYGDFDIFLRIKGKTGDVFKKETSGCSPSGFTLYVKDNLNTLKKERPGINHGTAVNVLRRQYNKKEIDFFTW